MSRFQRAAALLRGRGVQPAVTTLGGASATYVTVTGFTSRHILFAVAVTTAVCVSSAVFALWVTADWIGTASDRRVVEAVAQTGVDTTQLSAADLKARLSYKTTDGHILDCYSRVRARSWPAAPYVAWPISHCYSRVRARSWRLSITYAPKL